MKPVQAETVVTRISQANGSVLTTEADNDDTKPAVKTQPSSGTSSEAPLTLLPTDASDQRSSGVGLDEVANCVTSLDDRLVRRSHSSEDAHDRVEKTELCSVSCMRDLINSTIEKTLQDNSDIQHSAQTPPMLAVSGKASVFSSFIQTIIYSYLGK